MKKPGNYSGGKSKVEDALRLDESRLEALLRLNEMTNASFQDITNFAMEQGVRLTSSRIGYLAFVNEDETVLTMHSWSRVVMEECLITNKPIVYPMETVGLWGEAVRQRKPIVTNDYQLPNILKKGYPSGHVPVTRHMNVPIFDGEKIVAVAGVGNKLEPYDDSDVRQLQLMMDGMWLLLHRKRTEDALRLSEDKYKRLIETTDTGYVILDDQGRVIDANLEYMRMTGRNRLEEIIGHSVLEWTTPHDFERNEREIRKCLEQGFIRDLEIDYIMPGGQIVPIEVNATVLHAASGIEILTVCRDITDRKQAEEAIRLLEHQLRSYIDNAGDAIYILERSTGRIRNCNLRACHDLGYSMDELLEMSAADIETNLPIGEIGTIHHRMMSGGAITVDGAHRRKDGSVFPVEIRLSSLAPDHPELMIAIVRNITDRKKAEEALRKAKDELEQRVAERTFELSQSRARLATIFRTSPAAIFLSRMEDGCFLEVNDACLSILGYSADEMVGRTSLDMNIFVNPDDRQRAAEVLKKDGQIKDMEVFFRHKSGIPRILLVNALPLFVDGVQCILGTLLDITEQKQADDELKDSKALVDAVVENVPLMIFLKEATDLRFVIFNRAGEELLGYDRAGLLGKNNLDLFPPEQAAHFMANDREVLDGKADMLDIPEESILTAKKGQRLLHTRKVCIRGADGATKFLLGISEDITERKRAEEELKKANQDLECSALRLRALTMELTGVEQQERRRIAEILHDDIQQLLVAAKLNIAALAMDTLNDSQRDSTRQAIDALDQAIAKSRSLTVELNPVVLRDGSLARALQWLGGSMLQTHNLAVEVEAQTDNGRISHELCLVLYNAVRELLLNVIKHANVRSARIEMSMLPDNQVRIVVTDQGCGFEHETVGAANDDQSAFGLFAIRERLELLNGVMEIESHPGQGSRITLTAPIGPSAE